MCLVLCFFPGVQINVTGVSILCTAGSVRDYCLFDSFAAQCGDNEVIMVEHASYGRMKTGRCISGEGIYHLFHQLLVCVAESALNTKPTFVNRFSTRSRLLLSTTKKRWPHKIRDSLIQ